MSNEIVNRQGITFVQEIREKTGLAASVIARAFIATRDLLALPELWREIEALDNKVAAELQSAMLLSLGRATEQLTSWLLRTQGSMSEIAPCVERYRSGCRLLAQALPELLTEHRRQEVVEEAGRLVAEGVPQELAGKVALLPHLAAAADVVHLANEGGREAEEVARCYFDLGTRFGFDWMRDAAAQLSRDMAWDRLAITALIDDLYESQAKAAAGVLASSGQGSLAQGMEKWLEPRRISAARSEQLLAELQGMSPNLAMLMVANRQLKTLTEAS